MAIIRIKKGRNLPLDGKPEPRIKDAPRPARVALQPPDFRYLRPRLKVAEGDSVSAGSVLLEDKDDPRIVFVSPAGGKVASIHYGERRRILEVIIELSGEETFEETGGLSGEEIAALGRSKIVERLLTGGLWPMLRQRPFSRIARPEDTPKALLICATPQDAFDVNPNSILAGQEADFQLGIDILSKLAPIRLAMGAEASTKALTQAKNCTQHTFSGPYPSGNPAVQIYHACPPGPGETVWYISAQDVLAIARQLKTGRYSSERIISLCGTGAKTRTYLRSRIGASVESLTQGAVESGEMRYISGGVLTGRKVAATGFLGFYDRSLNIIPEGRSREMLSFIRPGLNKFSLTRAFLSTLFPNNLVQLNTNKNGSSRNFVLNSAYEDLCAVDILPQHLAKSILAEDIEESEKHGILDCAECGLCTFACPSKIEIGDIIRQGLDTIVKEG